ncbi:phage minor capsid protein [Ruminococcus sp.]|uniref:phage minor capsid protein n=1 Tax=Ruminococcus sp. TaxID=41978 RepID=UPI00386A6BA0
MVFSFFKKKREDGSELQSNVFSSNGAKQDIKSIIRLPIPVEGFSYKLSKKDIENNKIAYFKNGSLYNVFPRNKSISLDEDRGTAYEARYIVSDGKKYDLCNPYDVIRFKIPDYSKGGNSFSYVTRDLSYIIMKRVKRIYQKELCIPSTFLAVNLMLVSGVGWLSKDYERMLSQLERLEEYRYASILREGISKSNPSLLDGNIRVKNQFDSTLKLAKQLGTDLVVMPYLASACEECAKYQGRVYSITGKDKRFPKLPRVINETGCVHPGCVHHLQVFYEWETIQKYVYDNEGNVQIVSVDAIENSNRPFIDDRTVWEIEKYKKAQQKQLKKENELWSPESTIKYAKRIVEFEWIEENLPEVAPKSLGGYTRMKHSNSKNYQKIKQLAAQKGMYLDDAL